MGARGYFDIMKCNIITKTGSVWVILKIIIMLYIDHRSVYSSGPLEIAETKKCGSPIFGRKISLEQDWSYVAVFDMQGSLRIASADT